MTSLNNMRILGRMSGGGRRKICGIAVACLAALAAACGNYHPNGIAFTFTPVPVRMLPAVPAGRSGTEGFVFLDADCNVFAADTVEVGLDPRQHKNFERWLENIGFTVRASVLGPQDDWNLTGKRGYTVQHLTPDFMGQATVKMYTIGVPLGSMLEALTLIGKQPGVLEARVSYFQNSYDGPPPGERFFGCKTPR